MSQNVADLGCFHRHITVMPEYTFILSEAMTTLGGGGVSAPANAGVGPTVGLTATTGVGPRTS